MTNKLLVSVDVESDGPCPGLYSMVSFGCIVIEPELNRTFYGETKPLENTNWIPEALFVSGITREKHLNFPDPLNTIREFINWTKSLDAERLTLISDNPAFDAPWINYYCNYYGFNNPFGYSARRIGDIWSGFRGKINDHSSWKDLRKTRHTHNPLDDAKGNAEAVLEIMKRMNT